MFNEEPLFFPLLLIFLLILHILALLFAPFVLVLFLFHVSLFLLLILLALFRFLIFCFSFYHTRLCKRRRITILTAENTNYQSIDVVIRFTDLWSCSLVVSILARKLLLCKGESILAFRVEENIGTMEFAMLYSLLNGNALIEAKGKRKKEKKNRKVKKKTFPQNLAFILKYSNILLCLYLSFLLCLLLL